MARSSCCFVMFERPSMPRRFACLYSCSFVRLTPPEELRLREPVLRERLARELLAEALRLRELPLEPDLLLELRALDEPDFDLRREDVEPDRLFDPEALLRPERLDPPPELERRALELRCDCCRPLCFGPCCCSSSLSPSSPPRSFFATVTAAGTASPTAAPASAFLPVDIPSLSFSITSLRSSRWSVRCLRVLG